MILIDGSEGEGGGQILRTALSLSLVTGKAFRIENIRARRSKPGLLRQHFTAVQAATKIGQAEVSGAELGSKSLSFVPGKISAGNFEFSVGTAGSTALILQTVLPALFTASQPSTLILKGGTHNPFAPPFDFLDRVFCPVLAQMGPKLGLELQKYGFYPAGGGELRAQIQPVAKLSAIDLLERGALLSKKAEALFAHLSAEIANRELRYIAERMSIASEDLFPHEIKNSQGPGNLVMIEMKSEKITELFAGFGEIGVKAESVAAKVCHEAGNYLKAEVPVSEYLADQLLIPFALAGGGSFRTTKPSQHTLTNAEVIQKFLDVQIQMVQESTLAWRVKVF